MRPLATFPATVTDPGSDCAEHSAVEATHKANIASSERGNDAMRVI
jgi:hypothetical protein